MIHVVTAAPIPRIGVIGFGAIADGMICALESRGRLGCLGAVLVRPDRFPAATQIAAGRFQVATNVAELMASEPDIVVEAAGHEAVASLGSEILARGCDLLVASVGALADPDVARRLTAGARDGASLWIAAGAVAGLDGLLAARSAGLDSVLYRSVKPPLAWKNTPAEGVVDLDAVRGKVVFFRGSAREAARLYPRNANVGAAIALAGLGLDRTMVQLECDSDLAGPLGVITASGAFGHFAFEILALASPDNPKTSAITGHSLVSAVLDGMRFSPPAVLLNGR